MARGATVTVENNFTKGLVTEFTAMNFPENAVTEADNTIFSELGRVTRRLGMDYELNNVTRTLSSVMGSTPTGSEAFTEYKWFSVGNAGDRTMVVQQLGRRLRFFFVEQDGALSTGLKPFQVSLSTFMVASVLISDVEKIPCQFTSGDGYLFVAHPLCDPFYVEYDASADQITTSLINVQVRDMAGLIETTEPDFRPTTLSNLHRYNLLNQGWYFEAVYRNGSGGGTSVGNVLNAWDQLRTDFPSNSDIWWVYKDAENIAEFRDDVPTDRNLRGGVAKIALGNTPAPKGHYIYTAWNIDRSAKIGYSGLPRLASGTARPSTICWYAGRVWYAGTAANKYSGTLYFSQLAEGPNQFGKCYQANDPTSESTFDLLDTDGGTISLPLIEKVVAMRVINDALVIIGTNAVYTVRGSDNGPFRATNYTVAYTAPSGAPSHLSVIEAEGALLWINYDGIYAMNPDQVGVSFVINNVSKQSIQSIIEAIPSDNRGFVKGAYNKREQIIRWIYSDDPELTGYRYNRFLDFNVMSKAFYTHTIDTTLPPRVSGIVTVTGQSVEPVPELVTTLLGETVTDNALQPIDVQVSQFTPNQEVFKFTVTGDITETGPGGFTYGELSDFDYVDWQSYDGVGVPYVSYGVSGYRIRGELLRAFNSTPVTFVVRNMDGGSMVVSGIWDYGFRESSQQELYLTRPEVDYIIRRVKLRGKGKSLQIKFESVGNAPFELVGWSTFDTGGQLP